MDIPDEHALASVVDLSTHRAAKAATIDNDTDAQLQEKVDQHWENVFARAGLDLSSPQAPAAVIGLVTKELERLVGGLLVFREGRGDLPASPDAGVDFTSAVEVTGLLRELAAAVETLQGKRH